MNSKQIHIPIWILVEIRVPGKLDEYCGFVEDVKVLEWSGYTTFALDFVAY